MLEIIGTALNSISVGGKDRSLISIYFNGEIYVEKIKKSDIGYSTVSLLDDNGLIDEGTFNFLREDKSCAFMLLKLPVEFTETEIKYRKYRTNDDPELIFNDQGYYVARNWGIGNTPLFMDKMSNRFSQISYKWH